MLARELAKVAGPAGVRLLTPLLDEATAEQERGRRGGRDLCSLRRVDRPLAFFCAKSVNHAMARLSTGGRSGPLQARTLGRASLSASILPGITLPDGSGCLRAAAQGSLALPREVEQWPLTTRRGKLEDRRPDCPAWPPGRLPVRRCGRAAAALCRDPVPHRPTERIARAGDVKGEGRTVAQGEESHAAEPAATRCPGAWRRLPVAPHAQIAASGILHQSRRSTADPRNGSHLGDPGLNGALDHVQMRRSWRSSGHQGPLARGRARPLPPF